MHSLKKYILLCVVLGIITLVITACASMGSPSGGAYDFDPPRVVKTYPAFNATNVKTNKITLIFDENVTIENQNENVIVTPPQRINPVIRAGNTKITVELRDTLLPNTTYTIDFTNGIVDNNEKNPLENFSFSFSTGDVVDTMAVSGKVLMAENLEPVKGIYVGLHSNLSDTAFTNTRFEAISRTSETGSFTIKGIAPGTYRIFALDDSNRDYKYDTPSEAIAFYEATIEPSTAQATRMDTIYHDKEKLLLDTIKPVKYTRFLPDNIILRAFNSTFKRQYLEKNERIGANKVAITFGAPTEMPELEPLNFDKDIDWYVLEKSRRNDTLNYWIKDSTIIAMDTLKFRITYLKTDSLNVAVPVTDTLTIFDRNRKKTEKDEERERKEREKKIKKGEEVVDETIYLNIKQNLSATWDTYKDINLEFSEPIKDSLRGKIVLQHLVDTVWNDIPYQLEKDTLNPRIFTIKNKWKYENEYRILIDSAAIYSIYGLWNNKVEQKFKAKKEDEYGRIAIWVEGLGVDTVTSFIELLDKSDKPVRKASVKDGVAVFRDLNPGTYYARIILDANGNGEWDTGDYSKNLQPEMVCYMDKTFEVKANFDILENDPPWRLDGKPLDKQKPLEITKQKPKEKESRRKQLEEQEQRERGNRNDNRNNNRNNNMNNNNTIQGGQNYNTNTSVQSGQYQY